MKKLSSKWESLGNAKRILFKNNPVRATKIVLGASTSTQSRNSIDKALSSNKSMQKASKIPFYDFKDNICVDDFISKGFQN